MASPTRWTWVWASSRSWWRTGKPGMLQSMGLQRVGHNWVTELNWCSVSGGSGVYPTLIMLSMKEPQEGEAPCINQRYPRYNQSSSLRLSQFMWDTQFLPPTTGIPSAFSYKMFLPRQLVELWGSRQKSGELWELSKRIKEKAISRTVRGTSYAGIACSGENYTVVMHHVQVGKEVNNPLPSGAVLFKSFPWPGRSPSGGGGGELCGRAKESHSPSADSPPSHYPHSLLYLLLVSFFHIFPLISFTLALLKILKEKQNTWSLSFQEAGKW